MAQKLTDRTETTAAPSASDLMHLVKGSSSFKIQFGNLLQEYTKTADLEALPVVTPQQFGAVADGATNDAAAFQAMFDSLVSATENTKVLIPAGQYLINTTVTLPTIPNGKRTLLIEGYGAELITTAANVSIFKRMPTDQTDATTNKINANRTFIEGIHFRGDATSGGQIGIEVGATYMWAVRDCFFTQLDQGILGTFCLSMLVENCEATNVVDRPFTLRSAGDDLAGGGPVWTGGAVTNSASNASIFHHCRVFGAATQHSAYTILASDLVTLEGCISEGNGANYDVFFDYQGSTTVKNFVVRELHCEAPSGLVNVKAAINGQIILERIRRSHPAALLDLAGSAAGVSIFIRDIAYWGNMPSGSPWFYHTNGGGYGGTPSGDSTGSQWVFQNVRSVTSDLFTAANWENSALPSAITVHDYNGNFGYAVRSNYYLFEGKSTNGQLYLKNLNLMWENDDTAQNDLGKRGAFYYRPRGIYAGTDGVEAKGPLSCITNGEGVHLKDGAGGDYILKLVETADTGTTISLANVLGNYCNMASANSNTTFTTTGAVTGGWAMVLINAASEPTVTGATKIAGSSFTALTDMYMIVRDNGNRVEYYFVEI